MKQQTVSCWGGIVLVVAALSGCAGTPSGGSDAAEADGTWFKQVGDRRLIIHEGDLAGRIKLESLRRYAGRGVDAIGPVAGLQGEVTVIDGEPYIATLEQSGDGTWAPRVEKTWDTGAIFLAYGVADRWEAVPVEKQLAGLAAIETFVRDALTARGSSLEQPRMFRIQGVAETMTYHVIWKVDDAPHNRAEHHKAKIKFDLAEIGVRVVGAWADAAGEGVYTHPGKRTHLHVVATDAQGRLHSGHIDALTLRPGATLWLPVETP